MYELAFLLNDMKKYIKNNSRNNGHVSVRNEGLEKISNRLNRQVTKYIETYRPASAIQELEKYTKYMIKTIKSISIDNISSDYYFYLKQKLLSLCILFTPFAPHMSEEICYRLGSNVKVFQMRWPDAV